MQMPENWMEAEASFSAASLAECKTRRKERGRHVKARLRWGASGLSGRAESFLRSNGHVTYEKYLIKFLDTISLPPLNTQAI